MYAISAVLDLYRLQTDTN